MTIAEKIIKLTRQLYPRGRAFWMPTDSLIERMHRALAISEAQAVADAMSILDSTIPDNNNFTADDATAWERRLGLITNSSVPLADRKLSIQRKMNHPGNVKARQSHLFLQKQLQDAGFDVYVFENRFPDGLGGYTTATPDSIAVGDFIDDVEHGEIEHGETDHGGFYNNLIANHIEALRDLGFAVTDLRSTIFIGGTPVGSFANVDADREAEFRQIILKVKPAHITGFLFINYV